MTYPVAIRMTKEKGLGLFANRDFEPDEDIFHELFSGMLAVTNHSCDPNCRLDFIMVRANKPIPKGAEITVDYKAIGFDQRPQYFRCLCGSENCRGTIKIGKLT